MFNCTINVSANCIHPSADYNNFKQISWSVLQLCSLATKVANIAIISTEVLQYNKNLLEKQSQQHELNKDLREENIMLSKKVQGKPCIKETRFTFICALMHPYSLLNQDITLTGIN